MRKAFEVQLELGQVAIEQVCFPKKSRHELPAILAGLQWIFMTRHVRDEVLDLLAKQVIGEKKATGRKGMDLWHILVLGVVRLGLDCDYDHLEDLANNHVLLRQILGVAPLLDPSERGFHRKTLSQNVAKLDEGLLSRINTIVARHGLEVFHKEGRAEPLEIKMDSYVLGTNVHFPTDLNLLWDAQRKCLDLVVPLCSSYGIAGWRKAEDWTGQLKGQMRTVSQINQRGGAGKPERLRKAAEEYLKLTTRFEAKVFDSWLRLRACDLACEDAIMLSCLSYFHDEVLRHMDLIQRRLVNGEKIPHEDKVFSLFEPHTEWINKGKAFPPVELGHKLHIATSQHGIIMDYAILEKQTDVDALIPSVDRLLHSYGAIRSLSADKGYSRQEDKQLIELFIDNVVIPKRGRLSKQQKELEHHKTFRALRHQHSAVESDIHCLEHHGLNRCPDKGRRGYGRYVGLGVLAYNLHKIGARLLRAKAESAPAKAA